MSRGELALLISDLDDRLEALERSDRMWRRFTPPAALGVAAALYAALLLIGIEGVAVWVLINVLLALVVWRGGQVLRDRKRRSIREEREELLAIAATADGGALPHGSSDTRRDVR